jgi:O-antigen ligase
MTPYNPAADETPRPTSKSLRRMAMSAVALIVWGALAFGAVYPWAYWPLAAAGASVGVWALVRMRAWRDPATRAIGLAAAAVAAAVALQLVMLPYALLGRLSPALDRFFRAYEVGYHPASLHTLSLSPADTATALALFISIALLGLGLMRALRGMGVEWMVTQLMGFGVALAVFAVLQKAMLDPIDPLERLVYGFWRPRQGGEIFGPFINRNHFAGWMVMALPVVLGLLLGVLARLPRPASRGWSGWLRAALTADSGRPILVATAVLVMGMSVVLSGSRSGMAAFVVAMLVMAGWVLARVERRRVGGLAAASILVLAGLAAAWAGAGIVVDRFGRASADIAGRLSAWQDTMQIVRDFPVFGTGLGTYAQAMLVYQTEHRSVMYAQAHNDYLQLAAEGGLLVGLPVLVLVGLVVREGWRRLRAPDDDPMTAWLRAGAVAGLAGIAAQSFVEFSLQMPGNRVLLVLLLAILLHRSSRAPALPDAHRV